MSKFSKFLISAILFCVTYALVYLVASPFIDLSNPMFHLESWGWALCLIGLVGGLTLGGFIIGFIVDLLPVTLLFNPLTRIIGRIALYCCAGTGVVVMHILAPDLVQLTNAVSLYGMFVAMGLAFGVTDYIEKRFED